MTYPKDELKKDITELLHTIEQKLHLGLDVGQDTYGLNALGMVRLAVDKLYFEAMRKLGENTTVTNVINLELKRKEKEIENEIPDGSAD